MCSASEAIFPAGCTDSGRRRQLSEFTANVTTALIASYAALDPPLTITEEQITVTEISEPSDTPRVVSVVIVALVGQGPSAEEIAASTNTQDFTDNMNEQMHEPVALESTPNVIAVVVAPPPPQSPPSPPPPSPPPPSPPPVDPIDPIGDDPPPPPPPGGGGGGAGAAIAVVALLLLLILLACCCGWYWRSSLHLGYAAARGDTELRVDVRGTRSYVVPGMDLDLGGQVLTVVSVTITPGRNAFRRLLRRFSRSPDPVSDMLIVVTPSVVANQPVGLRVKRPSILRGLKGPQPRRGHFTPRFAVPRHATHSYQFDGPEEPGSNEPASYESAPTGPAA